MAIEIFMEKIAEEKHKVRNDALIGGGIGAAATGVPAAISYRKLKDKLDNNQKTSEMRKKWSKLHNKVHEVDTVPIDRVEPSRVNPTTFEFTRFRPTTFEFDPAVKENMAWNELKKLEKLNKRKAIAGTASLLTGATLTGAGLGALVGKMDD